MSKCKLLYGLCKCTERKYTSFSEKIISRKYAIQQLSYCTSMHVHFVHCEIFDVKHWNILKGAIIIYITPHRIANNFDHKGVKKLRVSANMEAIFFEVKLTKSWKDSKCCSISCQWCNFSTMKSHCSKLSGFKSRFFLKTICGWGV